MTSDEAPPEADGPAIRSFGRVRSRTLRDAPARRLAEMLPALRVPDLREARSVAAFSEVWLEIGFGAGEHLAAQAAARPDALLLGAEPFQNGVASLLGQIEALSLGNVRIHAGDVRELLPAVPDAGLGRVYMLFPDPWPKLRHHKRRLLRRGFVVELARVLRPGGLFRFATDWENYGLEALEALLASDAFEWTAHRSADWRTPFADHTPTRYERKGLGDVRPLFLEFRRRGPE